MCLGVPGEVCELDGPEARVDFGGAEKWVRVDIVGDNLAVGDYVLTHAGFAIRKIPERQVEQTVELYEAAAASERGPPVRGGETTPASDVDSDATSSANPSPDSGTTADPAAAGPTDGPGAGGDRP